MKSILIFGAGNIGRSFIGQIFSRSGYEIVFADVDDNLVTLLNGKKGYTVVIKENNTEDVNLYISPVRAVNGKNRNSVINEIINADYIATSIGKNALKNIFKVLAEGIEQRRTPVDIIIAENISDGASVFRKGIYSFLNDKTVINRIGFVETSIGKMVPMNSKKNMSMDPLTVYAEAYNTLLVDREGFTTSLPDIPFIKGVSPIKAYVERKLYIHNLGHAATAYLGYAYDPGLVYVWEVLDNKNIYRKVKELMMETGRALILKYPDVFAEKDITDYIIDLLYRFKNRSLNDTVYRVGKDLLRKLEPDDRLIDGYDLIHNHGGNEEIIKEVIKQALVFYKPDESGNRLQSDICFHKSINVFDSLVSRDLLLELFKL